MKLSSLVTSTEEELRRAGVPNPKTDAEILVAHVLGLRRVDLYLCDQSPTQSQIEILTQLVRRRKRREPLQYITGGCEFFSLPFRIVPGVFIPRAETEIVVEKLIDYGKRAESGCRRILDLGTGCGVIAVSLAKHLSPELVVATDISQLAVETARKNAILNGVAKIVHFVVGDGLDMFGYGAREKFDILACNPPYVATETIASLEPEVSRYEPRQAIDGGGDGLEFYRRILCQVASILREGGIVGFEIGEGQADAVCNLLETNGVSKIEVHKDLSGTERVVIGRKG